MGEDRLIGSASSRLAVERDLGGQLRSHPRFGLDKKLATDGLDPVDQTDRPVPPVGVAPPTPLSATLTVNTPDRTATSTETVDA